MIMMYGLLIFLIHLFSVYSHTVSADIVKITVPEAKICAGKNAEVLINVEVKEGYHIRAHIVNDEFLVPTTLEINSDKNIIMSKQVFPKAKKFKLEGTNKNLNVYDGNFEINVVVKPQKNIQKGKYTMDAKLHYQACDSSRCLFPQTINFIITTEVI